MTDVVPAVVLDDGSLTRSALARLTSIYPALDVHVIGLRADLISSLLTDMGVRAHQAPCTPSATSHDRLEQAIATVDTLGEGLLLTGPPLDGADMLRVLDDHTRDRGLVLHVLAPSGSGSHARVLAQTPEARGWVPVVGRVLAQTWGEYVSTTAGTARAEDLENGTTDVVVVASGVGRTEASYQQMERILPHGPGAPARCKALPGLRSRSGPPTLCTSSSQSMVYTCRTALLTISASE